MDNVDLLPDDPSQPMRMLVASDMYLSGPRCKCLSGELLNQVSQFVSRVVA
jgi:hypothetical protein